MSRSFQIFWCPFFILEYKSLSAIENVIYFSYASQESSINVSNLYFFVLPISVYSAMRVRYTNSPFVLNAEMSSTRRIGWTFCYTHGNLSFEAVLNLCLPPINRKKYYLIACGLYYITCNFMLELLLAIICSILVLLIDKIIPVCYRCQLLWW